MDHTSVEFSCAVAIQGLATAQASSGSWTDYQLPVGASDQWVTAVVGMACSELLACGLSDEVRAMARSCAESASHYLATRRPFEAGWGFNDQAGPDADSTAWTVRLLKNTGQCVRNEDRNFLLRHFTVRGGFSTYCRSDAWGTAHSDVTPNVVLALLAIGVEIPQAIPNAMLASCTSGGTWNSYWWRTSHYATALSIEAMDAVRCRHRGRLLVDGARNQSLHSTLDIACALSTAILTDVPPAVGVCLLRALLSSQGQDGLWQGASDLRVADPGCYEPWSDAGGRYFHDMRGLITTAFVLRALALWLRRGPR